MEVNGEITFVSDKSYFHFIFRILFQQKHLQNW